MRILIILILIIYVFYKTTRFIFKILSSGLKSDSWHFQTRQHPYSKKAPDSNLNIDNMPHKQSKKNMNYDEGEYVDFEELK